MCCGWHRSPGPRKLQKVVQARNNQACSQDGEQEAVWGSLLCVPASILSSRLEISVMLLSNPDLQQRPVEYKEEMQTI